VVMSSHSTRQDEVIFNFLISGMSNVLVYMREAYRGLVDSVSHLLANAQRLQTVLNLFPVSLFWFLTSVSTITYHQ